MSLDVTLPLSKAQQIVLVESIAFAVVAILVARLLFELQVLSLQQLTESAGLRVLWFKLVGKTVDLGVKGRIPSLKKALFRAYSVQCLHCPGEHRSHEAGRGQWGRSASTVLVRLINELLGLEARLGEAPLPSYLLRLSGCHNSGVQR